jgi:hypothetical protein
VSHLQLERLLLVLGHSGCGDDLTRAVQRNIGAAAGQLSIRSAYFEIGTGLVTLL